MNRRLGIGLWLGVTMGCAPLPESAPPDAAPGPDPHTGGIVPVAVYRSRSALQRAIEEWARGGLSVNVSKKRLREMFSGRRIAVAVGLPVVGNARLSPKGATVPTFSWQQSKPPPRIEVTRRAYDRIVDDVGVLFVGPHETRMRQSCPDSEMHTDYEPRPVDGSVELPAPVIVIVPARRRVRAHYAAAETVISVGEDCYMVEDPESGP